MLVGMLGMVNVVNIGYILVTDIEYSILSSKILRTRLRYIPTKTINDIGNALGLKVWYTYN